MSEIIRIILLTGGAGFCIFLGGVIARAERIRPFWLEHELRHSVVAYGGGILLGAVALVLVPEGVRYIESKWLPIILVLFGAVFFLGLERKLRESGGSKPNLMGMLLDFIPEAMALGGLVALGSHYEVLLAFLIGMQNLPEGFNAYRELPAASGQSKNKNLLIMAGLSLLGPVAGLFGYFFLAKFQALLGMIMLASSGGILYLLFQDIAPQAKLEQHWAPPISAVLGFCTALFGQLLLH